MTVMAPIAGGIELHHDAVPGNHSETGVLRSAMVDVRMRGPVLGDPVARAIATTLEAHGVTVLGERDLLADLFGSSSGRRVLIERIVTAAALPVAVGHRLQGLLLGLEPAAAVRAVLDGLPARDWDTGRSPSVRERFLLPPLPRSRSLRSTSIAVGDRVLPALPPPAALETRRAVAISATLQRLHPAVLGVRPTRFVHDPALRRSAATIDGDDVQIAADGSVVVGIGHRTTAHGAQQLARTLLESGAAPRVIVTTLPRDTRLDRLDRVLGLLDAGVALVHRAVLEDEDVVAWTLEAVDPDSGRLVAGRPRPLRDLLGRIAGADGAAPTVLVAEGRIGPADFLPLEPGTLLSGAPADDAVVRRLVRAGLEVVPVEGLPGSVHGVRRLVQPLTRDAVRRA